MTKTQKLARDKAKVKAFIENLRAEIDRGFVDRPWASREEQETMAQTHLSLALAHLGLINSQLGSDLAGRQKSQVISANKRAALSVNLQKAREAKGRLRILHQLDNL